MMPLSLSILTDSVTDLKGLNMLEFLVILCLPFRAVTIDPFLSITVEARGL